MEFPRENAHHYRAFDLVTGEEIPTRYSGHTLRFVARDLPPVGYKKVRLERTTPVAPDPGDSLQIDGCAVQNEFYRIEADCNTGVVSHFTVLRSGEELVTANSGIPFNAPVRADSLLSLVYRPMSEDSMQVVVRDERPVRLMLVTTRPGHLFRESRITLWEGLDQVDVEHTVDLETLRFPEQFEDYGVAFPIAMRDGQSKVEVLGGFLDPNSDRFPGITHDAFSLRRSVAVSNDDLSVSLSAADSRVIRIREEPIGEGVTLFANLVNNFPEDWNRWEENEGQIDYRFCITAQAGPFRPSSTGQFGWERNTPPVVRYTWLRSAPSNESFMDVAGEGVVLMALRPSIDTKGVDLHLMNMVADSESLVRISSQWLDIHSGVEVLGSQSESRVLVTEGETALTVLPGGGIQILRFDRASN